MSKCNKTQINSYLKSAHSTLVHAVGDSAKTVMKGDLPISSYYWKQLRKHINGLKTLSIEVHRLLKGKSILSLKLEEMFFPYSGR